MNYYQRVIVLGDGWGTIAVLKGLQCFKLPVYVVSKDLEVLSVAKNIADFDIATYENELLLFAGYKPIVPIEVLNKNTCINIHYSLLPAYRGIHSTVWAILNNESHIGLTIHLMNEFIDDGPIIYQYSVENDFKTNAREYMEIFNNHVRNIISSVLTDFVNGSIVPMRQDKSKASWVGKRTGKDCQIDFTKKIDYQKAFFRALVMPYPLPYFEYKGEKMLVTDVDFQPSTVKTHIGRILNIDNEGLWVKCADGYIIIKSMRDSYGNMVNYNKFRIGQYLNK